MTVLYKKFLKQEEIQTFLKTKEIYFVFFLNKKNTKLIPQLMGLEFFQANKIHFFFHIFEKIDKKK
jgi:hypothetical protein